MGARAEEIRRNAPALITDAMRNFGEFYKVKPLAKFSGMTEGELHNHARGLCFDLFKEALAKLKAGLEHREKDKNAALRLFSEAYRVMESADDIVTNFGNAARGKRLTDELETIKNDINMRILNAGEITKGDETDALTLPPVNYHGLKPVASCV